MTIPQAELLCFSWLPSTTATTTTASNPTKSQEVRTHLEHHDFKLRLRQALPTFDASGYVELTDPRGRKRGSTGMIFVATRKVKAETAEETWPALKRPKGREVYRDRWRIFGESKHALKKADL